MFLVSNFKNLVNNFMISFKTYYLEAHDKKMISLYRGSHNNETGFSRERINSIHNNGENIYTDNRSKTKTLFMRAWIQGNYDGIVKMLKAHLLDSSQRIYGLISYTISPDVAKGFSSLDSDGNIRTLKLPVKYIISSKSRLKQILNLSSNIKKQYLRDGIGFNMNRLFWNYKASDPDTEQEIVIFKWD